MLTDAMVRAQIDELHSRRPQERVRVEWGHVEMFLEVEEPEPQFSVWADVERRPGRYTNVLTGLDGRWSMLGHWLAGAIFYRRPLGVCMDRVLELAMEAGDDAWIWAAVPRLEIFHDS